MLSRLTPQRLRATVPASRLERTAHDAIVEVRNFAPAARVGLFGMALVGQRERRSKQSATLCLELTRRQRRPPRPTSKFDMRGLLSPIRFLERRPRSGVDPSTRSDQPHLVGCVRSGWVASSSQALHAEPSAPGANGQRLAGRLASNGITLHRGEPVVDIVRRGLALVPGFDQLAFGSLLSAPIRPEEPISVSRPFANANSLT